MTLYSEKLGTWSIMINPASKGIILIDEKTKLISVPDHIKYRVLLALGFTNVDLHEFAIAQVMLHVQKIIINYRINEIEVESLLEKTIQNI